jgi:hypothetical protein
MNGNKSKSSRGVFFFDVFYCALYYIKRISFLKINLPGKIALAGGAAASRLSR